jgi:TRAP-type C4-dicarboxylate transport system permease large subunit
VPSDRATGAMMPYVYMMCVGLLVVILVPWVTLVLPRILGLG